LVDIVIPKNNEEDFLRIAGKLGYEGICFLYPLKNFREKKKVIEEMQKEMQTKRNSENPQIKILTGILVDAEKSKSFAIGSALRKEADLIAVMGFSRSLFEKKEVDIIFGLEKQSNDFGSSRNSGLNEALCAIAKKNNIAISFSVSQILELEGVERTKIVGRIMQNIRLCRKYKLDAIIASFASEPMLMRSPHDMKSLAIVLGMEPGEAKNGLEKKFLFAGISED